ncbi:hypothetical protein BHM03_00011067, partial [Ensete ventricosum]
SRPSRHLGRAPIRPDVVRFVHGNLAENGRQPYAASKRARHQTSAESWGTGGAASPISAAASSSSPPTPKTESRAEVMCARVTRIENLHLLLGYGRAIKEI